MATSSIFRNVSIRDKNLTKALLKVLEKAKNKKYNENILSKPCKEVTGDEIEDILKDFKK